MKTLRELREKKLTPAEIKKREEIAKAMEKDNPDMPMGKKMAIATATAKRVAESDFEPHMMYDPKTGKGYKAEKPEDHVRMKKMGYTHEKPEVNEGKMKDAMLQRKDMAKLAGLYSKAMKVMPGSPAQKKIKSQIDQYRKELGMNESLEEQKDDAEYNDEGGMAISQLKTAKSAVEELMSIIKDNDNLPEWVQSKLTKAVDYMDSVRDYMASEKGGVQEAVKTTHVVIDTADGDKVVATASSEQGAKSSVASAERPPMNIKNKKTLKIVKLKRPVGDKQVDRMVGYPLKESVSIEENVIPKVKEIVAKKGAMKIDGVMVDMFTASAISQIYDKVNDANKAKMEKMKITQLANAAMKLMQKNSVHEAVSPAQQAAIAIAKKEKGEEPKKESRAYRDAMRGMKGNTKGMATTKKDKDIEATDDDRKAANKNIIMQLRKAADLTTGANIEFEKGKGKVDRATAQRVIGKFNSLQKPIDKEKFQNSIKSLADIKKILGR